VNDLQNRITLLEASNAERQKLKPTSGTTVAPARYVRLSGAIRTCCEHQRQSKRRVNQDCHFRLPYLFGRSVSSFHNPECNAVRVRAVIVDSAVASIRGHEIVWSDWYCRVLYNADAIHQGRDAVDMGSLQNVESENAKMLAGSIRFL
jgi:hypothetical protein